MEKRNVKAIILTPSRDFGRDALCCRLPKPLWPMIDKTVLQNLLRELYAQGIDQAVVCTNGDCKLLKNSIDQNFPLDTVFLEQKLPLGTAGSIRNAAADNEKSLLLVLPATLITTPNLDQHIKIHNAGNSTITVLSTANAETGYENYTNTQLYLCEPRIINLIPPNGYFDIKEGLIPAILTAGHTADYQQITQPLRTFTDSSSYLHAITDYLMNIETSQLNLPANYQQISESCWIERSADISEKAEIYPPCIIMANTKIDANAIIIGPAVIGQNVTIDQNTIIDSSVIWDSSTIAKNCIIKNCVVDYNVKTPPNCQMNNQPLTNQNTTHIGPYLTKASLSAENHIRKLTSSLRNSFEKLNDKLPYFATLKYIHEHKAAIIFTAVISALFIWSYLPGILDLIRVWRRSDEYSSGLLVPFLVIYVLWLRRNEITALKITPSITGIFILIFAQALRLFGTVLLYSSAERLALLITIAALALSFFGWKLLHKLFPLLIFSFLMLPLPRSFRTAITLPLQNIATTAAVFVLQAIGYNVLRQGNVIRLNDTTTIAVAEACNGLRMITAFFIVAGFMMLLIKRNWLDKTIVLISTLPIALFCNTVRLVITAIAFTFLSVAYWEKWFHDFGGYAMMPLAILALSLELTLLKALMKEPQINIQANA